MNPPKKVHSPIWRTHFSHVVPDLVLGPTFVHFWYTFGPPRLHFGLVWGPFSAPKTSILGPYGLEKILEHQFLEHPSGCSKYLNNFGNTRDVLEFFANRFLEHRTSHRDMNTSNKLVHTGDVLEFFDDPFLENVTSHTAVNTSSKFVHTRYHTLGGGR